MIATAFCLASGTLGAWRDESDARYIRCHLLQLEQPLLSRARSLSSSFMYSSAWLRYSRSRTCTLCVSVTNARLRPSSSSAASRPGLLAAGEDGLPGDASRSWLALPGEGALLGEASAPGWRCRARAAWRPPAPCRRLREDAAGAEAEGVGDVLLGQQQQQLGDPLDRAQQRQHQPKNSSSQCSAILSAHSRTSSTASRAARRAARRARRPPRAAP